VGRNETLWMCEWSCGQLEGEQPGFVQVLFGEILIVDTHTPSHPILDRYLAPVMTGTWTPDSCP
jgi:hypothetical protein